MRRSLGSRLGAAYAAGGLEEVVRRSIGRLRASWITRYRFPLAGARDIRGTVTGSAPHALACVAVERGQFMPESWQLGAWFVEFENVWALLHRATEGPFNEEYDVGYTSGQFLYCLIRWLQPKAVVETGVARGASTLLILAAMDANESGSLTSFDVSHSVGALVPPQHERWRLVILDPNQPQEQLTEAVSDLGPIDVFLHDSDHTYTQQMFEYQVAENALRTSGLLLSDDVDASAAFQEFSNERDPREIYIVDDNKVFGVVEVRHYRR